MLTDPTKEADEPICQVCQRVVAVHDGMEHTGICDHCAQGKVVFLTAEIESLQAKLAEVEQDLDISIRDGKDLWQKVRDGSAALALARAALLLAHGHMQVYLSHYGPCHNVHDAVLAAIHYVAKEQRGDTSVAADQGGGTNIKEV